MARVEELAREINSLNFDSAVSKYSDFIPKNFLAERYRAIRIKKPGSHNSAIFLRIVCPILTKRNIRDRMTLSDSLFLLRNLLSLIKQPASGTSYHILVSFFFQILNVGNQPYKFRFLVVFQHPNFLLGRISPNRRCYVKRPRTVISEWHELPPSWEVNFPIRGPWIELPLVTGESTEMSQAALHVSLARHTLRSILNTPVSPCYLRPRGLGIG